VNLHLTEEAQARLPERMRGEPKEFAGRPVARTNRTDGWKLIFENGDWVLMRPSGTEPLVRIYAEAATIAAAQKLAEEARAWITE
jgi:phosphomannomutase